MKNIILILIFISIITLTGCTKQDISKFAENAIENPQLCDSLNYSGTPFNSDVCYSYVASMRQDISFCENVIDTEAKKGCYYEVRSITGFTDLSDCEEVPEFNSKATCYESIAKGITDIEKCKEFPENYSYICYYEFAASTENVSICDQYFKPLTPPYIQEEIKRITAEAKLEGKPVTENFRAFDYIDNKHSSCYNFVAKRMTQSKLCLSPGCVSFVAAKTNKSKVCSDIEDLNFVGSEYYNLNDELDNCIMSVVTQGGHDNVDFCMLIKREWQRNFCITEIAIQTENIEFCKNIQVSDNLTSTSYLDRTEEYKIGNCYTPIARDNPEKCDEVVEDSMKLRNACYYEISRVTNNPDICKNIVIPQIDHVTCEVYLNKYNLIATPNS
jgi:hypothetical protein